MKVIKRSGQPEQFSFDKISKRIQYLCDKFSLDKVDVHKITQKVISGLTDEISTTQIDEETAKICSDMIEQPQLMALAGIISVSNHHKNTPSTFAECTEALYMNGKVNQKYYETVMAYQNDIENMIDIDRDYAFDYFAFKTLNNGYLLKVDEKVVEKIAFLWMRVAVGIHLNDLEKVKETYDLLSQRYFTHASPTLFNIGTLRQQCSSCFLMGCDDDLESMYDMVKNCAMISKHAGGIGVHLHAIRSNGSRIRSTGGVSNGIIKYIKVLNETARHINQGGKRKGSIAVYVEPHHADIFQFLDLRKNTGKEELRARDIFTALWISDEFMQRLDRALQGENVEWYMFNPDDAKVLHETFGSEYSMHYNKLVQEKKYVAKTNILDLWYRVLDSQIETGTPYLCYKDHVNHKTNQSNYGLIKSSNLCAEIVQYSDTKETAVCNLASICLSRFVHKGQLLFDFEKLHHVAKTVTRNMNKIIDLNYYPTPETAFSNFRHRPIGIGVQGLADVYMSLRIAFESHQARELNKKIFETIYHGCIEASIELAQESGSAYQSFKNSPFSRGEFQFDLWGCQDQLTFDDWEELRFKAKNFGLKNSLLTTCMPTASTAQIMGNNESIEPYTSNIYKRRTLAGEFTIINKHLMSDLVNAGLWNGRTIDSIIANNGSVQHILELPKETRELYKTVWEISQKTLIEQAADRGVFIDQSQSLNLWLKNPTHAKLSAMHMYSWKKGLKTGIYYLRTMAAIEAQNVFSTSTVSADSVPTDTSSSSNSTSETGQVLMCSSMEDCIACSG